MKRNYSVFVDTNVFIQLRDIGSLPWAQLLPDAAEVMIMVARPVVEELDRFKTSPRDRLRKRARLALGLIDAAAEAPDQKLQIKCGSPVISICIAPRTAIDWKSLPHFDPTNADDRLVAAASLHGDEAILLSEDRGPRLSAREIGLVALSPPEDWHLQDEPTEQEQKVSRLEKQLAAASNRSPQIAIKFLDAVDGVVTIEQPILDPLPVKLKQKLVDAVLSQNPRKRLTARPKTIYQPYALKDHQVGTYNSDYTQYEHEVAQYFDKLHDRIARIAALPLIRFEVSNSGTLSAARLVVRLETIGFSILANRSAIKNAVGTSDLPTPPEPPVPYNEFALDAIRHSFTPPPNPRDPTEMLWLDRPSFGDQSGSYGCDDFRPQRVYADEVGLWATEEAIEGSLIVAASADDIAELETSVEVAANPPAQRAWTDDLILIQLPNIVADILAEHL